MLDAAGVIFLSGRADWLYHPLAPLTAETVAGLATTRTYDGIALTEAAPLMARAPLGPDAAGSGWIARLTPVAANVSTSVSSTVRGARWDAGAASRSAAMGTGTEDAMDHANFPSWPLAASSR